MIAEQATVVIVSRSGHFCVVARTREPRRRLYSRGMRWQRRTATVIALLTGVVIVIGCAVLAIAPDKGLIIYSAEGHAVIEPDRVSWSGCGNTAALSAS